MNTEQKILVTMLVMTFATGFNLGRLTPVIPLLGAISSAVWVLSFIYLRLLTRQSKQGDDAEKPKRDDAPTGVLLYFHVRVVAGRWSTLRVELLPGQPPLTAEFLALFDGSQDFHEMILDKCSQQVASQFPQARAGDQCTVTLWLDEPSRTVTLS